MKELKDYFLTDLTDESYKKCFFPKSFVNKKLVEELREGFVGFMKKKEKSDKMLRMNSKLRTHKWFNIFNPQSNYSSDHSESFKAIVVSLLDDLIAFELEKLGKIGFHFIPGCLAANWNC